METKNYDADIMQRRNRLTKLVEEIADSAFKHGYQEGYASGVSRGFERGKTAGYEEGFEKGVDEGRRQEIRAQLIKGIEERFGRNENSQSSRDKGM